MTGDGQTATRIKGCRQCIVLGDQELEFYAGAGWYFEVRIEEVVAGWVGGLGIGVTTCKVEDIKVLPDRAWRILEACVWLLLRAGREQTISHGYICTANCRGGTIVVPK